MKKLVAGVAVALAAALSACQGNDGLATQFGAGSFEAGTDIKPGTYQAGIGGGRCSWSVTSHSEPGIILKQGTRREKVQVARGMVITSTGCGIWKLQ